MGWWTNTKKTLFGTEAPPVDPTQFRPQHGGIISGFIQEQLGRGGAAPTVTAPTAGRTAVAMGPQDQFRARELALADQLGGVASGQQMGAGEMGVRRQMQQALAGLQAQQRMARGSNAATAARSAVRAGGDMGVNAAGMSAQAALGDQQAARGMLGQLLGQGRGADIGLATTQAGLDQQRNLANAQMGLQAGMANQGANLQQQGLNNQWDLGLLGQLLGLDQAQLQAQLAATGMQQQFGNKPGLLGDLLGVGGQVGAAALSNPNLVSDERKKKNVADGKDAVRGFLDSLAPKEFDYKAPKKHGEGRFLGVMAQDVERSRLGKEIVRDTPDGKALDGRKVLSALLASVADLHGRTKALEGGK